MASISHHSFKKPDVMHTAVQTEEYVDPPPPVNVNVAPPLAPSIGIDDYLEHPVPLIQHIDVIPEHAPAPVIEVKCFSPSQQFPPCLLPAPVSEDVTPTPADSNTAPPTETEHVTPAPVLELRVSSSQQFSSYFMDAPVSEDVSPALAGATATAVTVTENVTPAPLIESNCVSQFQYVGRGLPQPIEDQIVDILAAPVPVIECIATAPPVTISSSPSQQLPQGYTKDTTGVASPRCSATAVEASGPEVVPQLATLAST